MPPKNQSYKTEKRVSCSKANWSFIRNLKERIEDEQPNNNIYYDDAVTKLIENYQELMDHTKVFFSYDRNVLVPIVDQIQAFLSETSDHGYTKEEMPEFIEFLEVVRKSMEK